MRKSVLSLCLFLPLFLTAQHEFAPLGAKWYYSYVQWFPPSGDEIIELEVTGIDTIQGRACKRIHSSLHWGCSDCNSDLHVYQENGKVFRLIDSTFQLFIDFNANAGDSWVVHLNWSNQDSIIIKVNSISWVFLPNGPPLRVQHISLFGSNSWTWGGRLQKNWEVAFSCVRNLQLVIRLSVR